MVQAGSLMPGNPVCLAVSGSEWRDQQEQNYSSDQGIQASAFLSRDRLMRFLSKKLKKTASEKQLLLFNMFVAVHSL